MATTRRHHRAGRRLGLIALAQTYTGDYRNARLSACHDFALLAGTPQGPEYVRETLTRMDRRDPYASGLLSSVPDAST